MVFSFQNYTTDRKLVLHPKEQMQALFAARKREGTDEFKETYRHRAGIEGTHSEASAHDGLAALSLYRSAQNPSGSCGGCHGDQCHPIDELATGRSPGTDSHLSLQTGDEAGSLRWRFDFATSNPCARGAPPHMKKCYTTQQERPCQRSMIRSCCEPGHQYDPDASQAPPSVAPNPGKHAGKHLTPAWHPVASSVNQEAPIRWKSFCHRPIFVGLFPSLLSSIMLIPLFQGSSQEKGEEISFHLISYRFSRITS